MALDLPNRPWRTVLLLLSSDFFALLISGGGAIAIRAMFADVARLDVYQSLWPLAVLFPMVYAAVGMYSGMALYPSMALGPADELRRATLSTTIVFLALAAATFLVRPGGAAMTEAGSRLADATLFSRSIFLMAWAMALFAVPVARGAVRGLFAAKPWWGHGVVVLGAGVTGKMVIESLRKHPELGLKPVAMLDDDTSKHGDLQGVPVLGGLDLAPYIAEKHHLRYAIVAMPGVPEEQLRSLYAKYGDVFPHLLIIPSLVGFSSLWVVARDVGGMMGLEVRQRLLLLGPRIVKRCMDLLITGIGGFILLPFFLLIALLIKLDSTGPVLFAQMRPGKDGRPFRIFKFRTMHIDADARLKEMMHDHGEEFTEFGKIKDDPRVTRVGRLLRRFSIDEFPQLINVLRGEMSLVGPRAYLRGQRRQLADHRAIIEKVPPGITGIWQVSGRSEVSMEQRLEMDAYYVRNWSVWLDLYILLRTAGVVVTGKGAY